MFLPRAHLKKLIKLNKVISKLSKEPSPPAETLKYVNKRNWVLKKVNNSRLKGTRSSIAPKNLLN